MKIMAVDPGNVTGVSVYDTLSPEPPATYEIPRGLYGFVDYWPTLAAMHGEIHLVAVEDYIIRPDTHRKTREPDAYELLGWVKGKCHELKISCMPIGPGEHTPFSDYKRKQGDRVGLNWRVPNVRGKRAVRHVIFDTNFWKSFVHARLAVPMAFSRECWNSWSRDWQEPVAIASG